MTSSESCDAGMVRDERRELLSLLRFALPFMLSCFLQSFYGLTDLFVIGHFNGASSITAVSIGSQVIHMLTVVITGLCMGSTVSIGRCLGAGDREGVSRRIGNTVLLFALFSAMATVLLVLLKGQIAQWLLTPSAALGETEDYLLICFLGVPFITAYNVISGIYRGLGDTVRPMAIVAVAGVVNLLADYVLVGMLDMGAAGAAWATVAAQGLSVLMGCLWLRRSRHGISLHGADLKADRRTMGELLHVGVPIALQDGFIQVSFLAVTAIANNRGLEMAAAVGIVEKFIGFLFLVPSAMLSSVSALCALSAGAGKHDSGRRLLHYALDVVLGYGALMTLVCAFWGDEIVGLFVSGEPRVVELGGQYLRGYIADCAIAGVHFCFSGYFCAYRLAGISFFHNVVSIVVARVPGAYLASVWWPETLFPMGLAVPLGSLVSVLICMIAYRVYGRRGVFGAI